MYCCLLYTNKGINTVVVVVVVVVQVVYVWEVSHGGREKSPVQLHLKHTLHGHNGQVICLATSSSYNLIASGSKVSRLH